MSETLRVMICDDHELVREGLRTLLSDEPGFDIVGEAANGRAALAMARELRPQVVLMDVRMPELDGIEATRIIRETCPGTHVLILTTYLDDKQVRQAVQAGAAGYLLKEIRRDDLVKAIRDAAEGRPTLHPDAQRMLMMQVTNPAEFTAEDNLTPRERDVLRLIAKGRSNKEIGAELNLTEGTVKGYVSSLLVKLGVEDRTQAALLAVRQGLDE
jgi:DNA-binding NarL/FixJ family response regulator